jgi:hypothetical protein
LQLIKAGAKEVEWRRTPREVMYIDTIMCILEGLAMIVCYR